MVTYHIAVTDEAVAEGKDLGKGLMEAKAQELALTLSNQEAGEVAPSMEDAGVPFGWFIQQRSSAPLRNALLYDKYFSRAVVDLPSSAETLALPDKKNFPSLLSKGR